MLELIVIIVVVGLAVWYVTTLEFEIGTGFSEAKKRAREVLFTVKERGEPEKKRLESEK